jgi:hypothetical protein
MEFPDCRVVVIIMQTEHCQKCLTLFRDVLSFFDVAPSRFVYIKTKYWRVTGRGAHSFHFLKNIFFAINVIQWQVVPAVA